MDVEVSSRPSTYTYSRAPRASSAEFTTQSGVLFLLHTGRAKRTDWAAPGIAVDMIQERLLPLAPRHLREWVGFIVMPSGPFQYHWTVNKLQERPSHPRVNSRVFEIAITMHQNADIAALRHAPSYFRWF